MSGIMQKGVLRIILFLAACLRRDDVQHVALPPEFDVDRSSCHTRQELCTEKCRAKGG